MKGARVFVNTALPYCHTDADMYKPVFDLKSYEQYLSTHTLAPFSSILSKLQLTIDSFCCCFEVNTRTDRHFTNYNLFRQFSQFVSDSTGLKYLIRRISEIKNYSGKNSKKKKCVCVLQKASQKTLSFEREFSSLRDSLLEILCVRKRNVLDYSNLGRETITHQSALKICVTHLKQCRI